MGLTMQTFSQEIHATAKYTLEIDYGGYTQKITLSLSKMKLELEVKS